jgi:hypothetical protein
MIIFNIFYLVFYILIIFHTHNLNNLLNIYLNKILLIYPKICFVRAIMEILTIGNEFINTITLNDHHIKIYGLIHYEDLLFHEGLISFTIKIEVLQVIMEYISSMLQQYNPKNLNY